MKKEKPTTKLCKHCKTEIPYDAKICPQCRKKQGGNKIVTAAIVLVALGAIASATGTSKPASTVTSTTVASTSETEAVAETTTVEESSVAETETSSVVADPSVPTEYTSALNKAMTYSSLMHMSKVGIYNQLTSEYGEKFSAEAAQYAVDNMTADWNANALAKAQNYSDMNMSKAGIYDQLISEYGENFTAEEAQYAVDNMTADWNANALAKAKTYQETMNMSPEAIRDQLTSEYGEKFTAEEADYAVSNLQ